MRQPFTVELYGSQALPFAHEISDNAPSVDVFIADPAVATGYAMLVFAAGGYHRHSPITGVDYGAFFSAYGITVINVNYRLGSQGYDGRAFCADAYAAVALAQAHADQWHFDEDKLGLIGSSAGGHLAAMLSTGQAEKLLTCFSDAPQDRALEWRPAFLVLCYSLLSLQPPLWHTETAHYFLGYQALCPRWQRRCSPLHHVSEEHCRTFLWHTHEDQDVPIDNTIDMYLALRAKGVPVEMHAYAKGPHSLGLAQDLVEGRQFFWPQEALRWIVDEPVALA